MSAFQKNNKVIFIHLKPVLFNYSATCYNIRAFIQTVTDYILVVIFATMHDFRQSKQ